MATPTQAKAAIAALVYDNTAKEVSAADVRDALANLYSLDSLGSVGALPANVDAVASTGLPDNDVNAISAQDLRDTLDTATDQFESHVVSLGGTADRSAIDALIKGFGSSAPTRKPTPGDLQSLLYSLVDTIQSWAATIPADTSNPNNLIASLSVDRAIIPTMVSFSPTLNYDYGILLWKQYRVYQGGAVVEAKDVNAGDTLDLYPYAGQEVVVELTAVVRSGFGTSTETAQVALTVPTFTRTLTLDDQATQAGTTYNDWSDAVNAITDGDILLINPHSSGQWDLATSDYRDVTGRSNFAIRGVNNPLIDGGRDNLPGPHVWDFNACNEFSVQGMRLANCYKTLLLTGPSAADSEGIFLEDLTITGTYGYAVHVERSNDVRMSNCSFLVNEEIPPAFVGGFDRAGRGIYVSRGTGFRLNRVTTSDSSSDGTVFQSSSQGAIQDVEVWNHLSERNGRQGLLVIDGLEGALVQSSTFSDNDASGIQIEASTGSGNQTRNIIIRGNYCTGNSKKFTSECGIWIDESADTLTEHNVVQGNGSGLIPGYLCNRMIMRHNCVTNNNSVDKPGNISWGIQGRSDSSNVAIYNNTMARNGSPLSSAVAVSTNGSGIYTYLLNASNWRFKNNIVSEHVLNSASDNNSFQIMHAGGIAAVSEWNHNIYWDEPRADGYALSNAGAAPNYNFADYKTNSGLDADTLNADPQVSSVDCALSETSPALNAADSLTTVSSNSGVNLTVGDGSFFHVGDDIQVGDEVRKVASKSGNVLTLKSAITASPSDPVYLFDYELGKVVNIGAK